MPSFCQPRFWSLGALLPIILAPLATFALHVPIREVSQRRAKSSLGPLKGVNVLAALDDDNDIGCVYSVQPYLARLRTQGTALIFIVYRIALIEMCSTWQT